MIQEKVSCYLVIIEVGAQCKFRVIGQYNLGQINGNKI